MRQKQGVFSLFLLSLSSRRAWIEMKSSTKSIMRCTVALLAEGVDRNIVKHCQFEAGIGRSPRGGRG